MAFRFRINGSTRRERQEAIAAISDAVGRSGGWLLDFHVFSNISLSLNVEIDEGRLVDLYRQLVDAGLRLSRESEEDYARLLAADRQATGREIAGTVQVTFIHDHPDLRIEVPAVPG